MHSYQLDDTIVALATPPGVGAIGVIRLSGPQALEIANALFRGKDLRAQASHTIHYGTIEGPDGQLLDEVLVSLFRAPKSYTGEDVVEISCHGSEYILQQVIQLCIAQGARLARPGEFTLRAFLNGKMDLSQAEAVADLIASDTESAHRLALQQMRGGFSREIENLRRRLIDFASLIELELDFSEEDVEFADRSQLRALVERIRRVILELLQSFQLGNAIRRGVSTVIAGRPNAGKSTLLNALLREERAIVSDIPGTTRDTVEEVLNIRGIPFRLIDTAGIRDAQDQIEAVGVERTFEKIRQSALLLYVFDLSALAPEEVRADLQKLKREGLRLIVLGNKLDKAAPETLERFRTLESSSEWAFLTLSAARHHNIEALRELLYRSVVGGQINLESPIVANARHYEALQKALESLDEVLRGLESGLSSDLVALDIRRALQYLGEITGEVTTDDLLENIFSHFCIGK